MPSDTIYGGYPNEDVCEIWADALFKKFRSIGSCDYQRYFLSSTLKIAHQNESCTFLIKDRDLQMSISKMLAGLFLMSVGV